MHHQSELAPTFPLDQLNLTHLKEKSLLEKSLRAAHLPEARRDPLTVCLEGEMRQAEQGGWHTANPQYMVVTLLHGVLIALSCQEQRPLGWS